MAWVPALLDRSHGMPSGQSGLWFGSILGLSGVIGLLVGGSWADWQVRKGRSDGHVQTTLIGASAPFLIAAPLMPHAEWALGLLAIGFTFAFIPFGVAGSALQLITPNRLRGKRTALCLLCTSLAGLGLRPTTFALRTDYVFHDDAALQFSIALVIAVAMPVAILFLTLARKPFRQLTSEGPT